MIIFRREHPQIIIPIKDLSFKKVCNFKYLRVDINSQTDNHEEIHRKITAGNKCYFSFVEQFKSKRPWKKQK